MHPFNNFLPRLFPVILVLGAAALIAQLVLNEPDESDESDETGGGESGAGGEGGEGSEGSEGSGGSEGADEGYQPA